MALSLFIPAALLTSLSAAAPPRGAPLTIVPLELTWTAELAAAPSAGGSVAVDRVFVPLRTGELAAVALDDASLVWSIDLPTSVPPVSGEASVYVVSGNAIHALNPSDGTTRWRVNPGGALTAPLLWNGGWLVAAVEGGDVVAYRGESGEVLWRQHIGAVVTSRPAIESDRLYVPLDDDRVMALHLETGRPLWARKLGGAPGEILATPDRVYVGARDNFLYSLDAHDGDLDWQMRGGADTIGAPAIDDAHIYYVMLDNVLRALDRRTGNQRWRRALPSRPFAGPLLVGSTILVSGLAPELRAFDARTGEPAGEFAVPSELTGPPELVRGLSPALSTLVVLTGDGRLHGFRRRFDPFLTPLETVPGTSIPLEIPLPAIPTEFLPGIARPPEALPAVKPPSRPLAWRDGMRGTRSDTR